MDTDPVPGNYVPLPPVVTPLHAVTSGETRGLRQPGKLCGRYAIMSSQKLTYVTYIWA